MTAFSVQLSTPKSRSEVLSAALTGLGRELARNGYGLREQDASHIVWEERAWVGVLRLLFVRRKRVTLSMDSDSDGMTSVTIAGDAPRRLARQLSSLEI